MTFGEVGSTHHENRSVKVHFSPLQLHGENVLNRQ